MLCAFAATKGRTRVKSASDASIDSLSPRSPAATSAGSELRFTRFASYAVTCRSEARPGDSGVRSLGMSLVPQLCRIFPLQSEKPDLCFQRLSSRRGLVDFSCPSFMALERQEDCREDAMTSALLHEILNFNATPPASAPEG